MLQVTSEEFSEQGRAMNTSTQHSTWRAPRIVKLSNAASSQVGQFCGSIETTFPCEGFCTFDVSASVN
jgi:hypothetical protein